MSAKLILGDKTYSSWSQRGWLAVRHSGFEAQEVVLPLRTERFAKEIRDHSPTGKVPCLIDGETTVWDSLAIIDYLDKKFSDVSYWPEDLATYGLARAAAAEMHSGFQALRRACPFNLRMKLSGFEADDATIADVSRIVSLWKDCLKQPNADGPYLFGKWGAVDIMFAPVVSRFETYGLTMDSDALSYMDEVLAHPHIAEWTKAAMLEPDIGNYDDIPQGDIRLGFPGA